jgi:catechol 2,3-dioxygenase-like lactoylglutathione lyase family enzyme
MAQATETKRNEIFTEAFSSFSVDDVKAAKEFYGETLGLNVGPEKEGGLSLRFENGATVYVYPKDDHEPATFTILNLSVDDIDTAVDDLTARGIEFESYGGDIETDDKGIYRGADSGRGPNIAWFKDPAGNILSVMEGK